MDDTHDIGGVFKGCSVEDFNLPIDLSVTNGDTDIGDGLAVDFIHEDLHGVDERRHGVFDGRLWLATSNLPFCLYAQLLVDEAGMFSPKLFSLFIGQRVVIDNDMSRPTLRTRGI